MFNPLEQETAISVFYPREDTVDQGYTTFGYMKMQMVVAHGGRCAERVVFGDDLTDGGTDDLEKITKVVHVLVYYYYPKAFFQFQYIDVLCNSVVDIDPAVILLVLCPSPF